VTAGVCNLRAEQGATFRRVITMEGADLTGSTARAHVCEFTGGPLVVAMTCQITDPANGVLTISLTAEQTAAIQTTGRTYAAERVLVYDLEIEAADGTVQRILNGSFTVSPEATR
jgi:hypothetical protein